MRRARPDEQGPRRGGKPQPISRIIERVMRDVNPAPRRRKAGVEDAWAKAAGAELGEETRPATLRGGVLTVEVRSPALLHELQGFRRQELLTRVLENDATGRISGLKFRLGVF